MVEGLAGSTHHQEFSGHRYSVDSIDDTESAADQLRKKWDLGSDPIPNLTELLESKGIKVILLDLEEFFEGISALINNEIPVIVCNRRAPGDRQRFTLAHELAHMVLDTSGKLDEEAACHRFAGAFLAQRISVVDKLGFKRRVGKRKNQETRWPLKNHSAFIFSWRE